MPLGLILCAGKKHETVELLELAPRGIHVAAYLTALPPRELLQQRLRDAITRARSRLRRARRRRASVLAVAAVLLLRSVVPVATFSGRADDEQRLQRMQADAADRAVVTQSVLRLLRVIAGENHRGIGEFGAHGTRCIHAAREEPHGVAGHWRLRRDGDRSAT